MAPACPLAAERGSIGVFSELRGPRTEVGPAYLGLGERPGCWWRWELGCPNWKALICSLKACQRAPPTGLPRWCRDESHSPPVKELGAGTGGGAEDTGAPGARCVSASLRDTEEAQPSPPGDRRGPSRLLRRGDSSRGMSLVCGGGGRPKSHPAPRGRRGDSQVRKGMPKAEGAAARWAGRAMLRSGA